MQEWQLGVLFVTAVACTAAPVPDLVPDAARDVAINTAPSDTPSASDAPADAVTPDAPLADVVAPDAPLADVSSADAATNLPCGAATQPCCPVGASSSPCAPGLVCAPSGACEPCPEGLSMCAGACVDVSASAVHCGRCGNACPTLAHASTTCSGGTCGFSCNRDYGDCDGDASNGCERHVFNDDNNCGRCGRNCGIFLTCRERSCSP